MVKLVNIEKLKINCQGHTSASQQIALLLTLLSVILLTVGACAPQASTPVKEIEQALSLSSTAFKEGDQIPVRYTGDGQDTSPPLEWSKPPPGTQTFALIVDDPDAPRGVFTHWVLFNLPADTRQLPEGIPTQDRLENGARQGKNDFGKTGYGGPYPPPGTAHRYRFTLYALDKPLDLLAGASQKQVLDAMKGVILAQGQLTATYRR